MESSELKFKQNCEEKLSYYDNHHQGNMCILFSYIGTEDSGSDYSLILASNRDEAYDRPSSFIAPWASDSHVIGGRDLEPGCDGGTWLALSPLRKKIGVLLNLPSPKKPNAKTRGKIVADFVKSNIPMVNYVDMLRNYGKECNDFIFVSYEIGSNISVNSYNNSTDELKSCTEQYFGFSNSLPETPLQKVLAGRTQFQNICDNLNKINDRSNLVEELIMFLKSSKRHLPDPEIKKSRPNLYEQLSSIFVKIPELRYGTRTHTIILVTKTGDMYVVESTLEDPVDLENPKWNTTELQFNINL